MSFVYGRCGGDALYAALYAVEAAEGGLCLRDVSEALEVLEVPAVMPCVRLCMPETVEGVICLREVWRCWRCRRRCGVCYSVCWRLWGVGSICWMRCAVCCSVCWRPWRMSSLRWRCWR